MQTHWIYKGNMLSSIEGDEFEGLSEADLLHKKGVVKVNVDREGTRLQWSVFSPNWLSLYWLVESLQSYPGPYVLEFHLVGWFEETYEDVAEARSRIHELISKSDVHILSRTFVKSADPNKFEIPNLLQDAIVDGVTRPEYSVDCLRNPTDDKFQVTRIGQNSLIAKLWGLEPVSYPCVNGGSYDQIVSEIYPQVIRTGEPHYGHVYAAMSFPKQPVRWFRYQRVILPTKFPDGHTGVTVISSAAKTVDIKVV